MDDPKKRKNIALLILGKQPTKPKVQAEKGGVDDDDRARMFSNAMKTGSPKAVRAAFREMYRHEQANGD